MKNTLMALLLMLSSTVLYNCMPADATEQFKFNCQKEIVGNPSNWPTIVYKCYDAETNADCYIANYHGKVSISCVQRK
jgi:hypothetical protein